MANGINIDPSISLGIKPPAAMTLPQMLDMARSAQAFQQAQQVFPEQAEQARIATRTAQTQEQQAMLSLSQNQNNALMGIVGGYRNDPRIASGNPDAALAALDEIKAKAVAAGIPRSRVEQIGTTATNIAINNPKALPQYFDNVIQSQAGAASQLGLQTPELTTQAGAPALLRRGAGTLEPARIVSAPRPAPQAAPQAAPAGQPPAALQAAPRAGVTSEMMTAPNQQRGAPQAARQGGDAGFPIRFPVRPAGDIRPMAPGEENARALGEKTRASLLEAQAEVPRGNRSVGEIIRIADDLAKDVRFQTGGAADIERALRQNLGDARYKELAKDIAQVQMAVNKANNANTDQQTAQVAAGTGDATYPPDVLIKIARRLRGELTEIDARTRGAQEFARRFGDANLADFQQAWSQNSDLRNFEVMAILRDIRNPDAQKAALDKILPNNQDELRELQRKYQAIDKLTRTGTLR